MNQAPSFLESIPYKISYNTSLQDKKYGITDSVKELLEDLFFEIGKGKKSTIKRLERACKKYPRVPQFKNYLSKEYLAAGNEQKSLEVTGRILEKHPGLTEHRPASFTTPRYLISAH